MWAAEDFRGALKLAASWPRLGEHKEAIQQGWAAASNPEFYKGLRKDPDALYLQGVAAVAARYKLAVRWRSVAAWPHDAPASPNPSTDTHYTLDGALAVRVALQRNGLGGDRQHYPVRVWVEPKLP